MSEFNKDLIRGSSIPLPDGGDTHFHAWENGRGFSVTTRLPGGVEFHDDFRFKDMFGQRSPATPDGLKWMP